jgi:putative ABC transport system permease protein
MLIFQLIQRHILRRRLQSLLFVLGVALGVAVGVAIDLANNSASRAFSLSSESITGRTTHQIVGGPAGLPAELYQQLRDDLGLQDNAPVITRYVRGVDLGDQPLRLLGVDLQAELPFRNYTAQEDLEQPDLVSVNAFLNRPNTAFISETLAQRFELSIGDSMMIRVDAQQVEMEIVGLLRPNDTLSQEALDDLLLVSLPNAQALLDMEDRLTRIDLILPADYDTTALEALMPAGAVLTTPQQRTDALEQMTWAFEINLRALSLLGLVVGVFLIYNTVMFSVVQRRGVIGILRSLGTSKQQIFLLVIGEAALLGSVGTILGLGLGVLMGRGAVNAVSQTVSDLYFRVNVQEVAIAPQTLLTGAVVGVLASLIAAFVPSLEATRTTPAGSMRRSDLEQKTLQRVPYVTGAGALLIAGGIGLLQLPTDDLIVSFTALFMVIIGGALFTPLSMILLMGIATPITGAVFGVLGRMAPRSVVRSLSRTSVAVAALTLAVSVIVGVGTMISSFRGTVADWLNTTLGADIFVGTPGVSTDSAPNLDPDLIAQLESTSGVARVAVVRETEVIAPDFPDLPPVELVAPDTDISGGRRRFAWNNLPDGKGYFEALQEGGVMVSEPFAFHRGITPENNKITLLTDRGPQEFTIFGVYYDYSSDRGLLMMYLDVYRSYFDDPYLTSFGLFVEPGTDLDTVIDTLRTETLIGQDLEVQSNRQLREGALEVFDRTFSITVALQVLATLVAFIGILSALMALQLEHQREYGILRANGMTPGQLQRFTLIQTGLMGLTAGILAVPIGLALALILIQVINVRSFGWTMPLQLPPEVFAQAFAVALVASLLAGLYPAYKVSRVRPTEALRSE